VVFLFFVAPPFAVFWSASVFNQDVSKWKTGAVTDMSYSKCTLSPLSVVMPSVVVYFEYTTTRVSSADHTSHTFCYFNFVFLKRYFCIPFCYCLRSVGLSFLCCTPSCSVLVRICVQSGRVQMEYGGGDKYVSK
jgi:surface protein